MRSIGKRFPGGARLTVDDLGKLHLNGTLFHEELLASMLLFADYLDANDENGGTATLSQDLRQMVHAYNGFSELRFKNGAFELFPTTTADRLQ